MSSWFRTHPYFYLAGTEHVKDRKLQLSLFRKVYGSLQRFILQEDYSMHQTGSAVLELPASIHSWRHSIPPVYGVLLTLLLLQPSEGSRKYPETHQGKYVLGPLKEKTNHILTLQR